MFLTHLHCLWSAFARLCCFACAFCADLLLSAMHTTLPARALWICCYRLRSECSQVICIACDLHLLVFVVCRVLCRSAAICDAHDLPWWLAIALLCLECVFCHLNACPYLPKPVCTCHQCLSNKNEWRARGDPASSCRNFWTGVILHCAACSH